MSDNDEFEEIDNTGITNGNGFNRLNVTGSTSEKEESGEAAESVEAVESAEAVEAVEAKESKAVESKAVDTVDAADTVDTVTEKAVTKVAKPKAVLSETQKEMQRKRKEKLVELQKIYDERFSNIPKDERPKAKAYYAVSLIAAKDPVAKLEEILKKEKEAYDDKKAGIKRPKATRKNKVYEEVQTDVEPRAHTKKAHSKHHESSLSMHEGISLLPISIQLDVQNSLEKKMKELGNNNAMTHRIRHTLKMMSLKKSKSKSKSKSKTKKSSEF